MPAPEKQILNWKWNIIWSLGSAAAFVLYTLIQAISVGNTEAGFLGFMLQWMALAGAIVGPAMRWHCIAEDEEIDSNTSIKTDSPPPRHDQDGTDR